MREATATIDLDALRRNLQRIRGHAPNARVLAVVKADGYGHGLERVARALRTADGYGVAGLEDATRIRQLELRQGWARKPIVLLSGIDEARDVPVLHSLDLDCVVHDPEQMRLLQSQSAALGPLPGLWLKLDTGMHRLGFAPECVPGLRAQATELLQPGRAPVWMTHFASADEPASALTALQIQRFQAALQGVPGARSLANSAAVVRHPEAHADWVRPGGLLYGLSSFDPECGADLGFEPVMTLSSRIIAVKQVAAGETIGYGESERLARDTRVGIVSIGYGDGFPRHASGVGARVRVEGCLAPVLGRVSMDLSCIDLSEIPAARVGSAVMLWGPELPPEHLARQAGTISYELTCGITRRVTVREVGAERMTLAPEPATGGR